MITALRHPSLGAKLAGIVAILLLPLLVLTTIELGQRSAAASSAEQLEQLVTLDAQLMSFVHESQRERGLTGLYLGSAGKNAGDELAAQREKTDAALTKFTAAIDRLDREAQGRRTVSAIAAVERGTTGLGAHRDAVDALKVDGAKGLGFYTNLNAAALDVLTLTETRAAGSSALQRRLGAYGAYLRAKELTGIERGTMSKAWNAGAFAAPADLASFAGAVSGQATALQRFTVLATPADRAAATATVSGPEVETAEQMRARAMAGLTTNTFSGVTGPQWFAAMTAKIDLMHTVERRLSQGVLAAARDHQAGERRAFLVTAIGAGLALLLGIGFALALVRGIQRSAKRALAALQALHTRDIAALNEGLQAVAARDLTCDVEATVEPVSAKGDDELAQLCAAIDGVRESTAESIGAYALMRDALSETIRLLSTTAVRLDDASESMAQSSSESGRAVAEIAEAIGEIAAGAERQVRSVESARTASEAMSTATVEGARTATATAQQALEASAIAARGAQTIEQAGDAMEAVRAASAAASDRMRALGHRSERIGSIVETITGIAEQTNLLALNAAIEAARAGDHGSGFAVVADEVRKLAEDSSTAARAIAELIAEMQTETSAAVAAVEDGSHRTETGAVTVAEARDAFRSVGAAITEVSGCVREIAATVESLATESTRVQQDVEEVAAVAEQSSAASEEVSASAQETSASAEEIHRSADALRATAHELEEMTAQFRLA